FVGGEFDNAGGISTSSVAKWNGRQWAMTAAGLGTIYCFTIHDGGSGPQLVAGGQGTIKSWVGNSWASIGLPPDNIVFSLALSSGLDGNALYAAGNFSSFTGSNNYFDRVARWDGTNWRTMSRGIESSTNPAEARSAVISSLTGTPRLYVVG